MLGALDLAAIMVVMVFLALGIEAIADAIANKKTNCNDDRVTELEKKIEEIGQRVDALAYVRTDINKGDKRE